MYQKIIIIILIFILSGCAVIIEDGRPSNTVNACEILKENKSWNRTLHFVKKDWSVSKGTILAFMYQESSFRHNARPVKGKRWFFFNDYASSARGYSQALNGTWQEYKEKNNKGRLARRSSFKHSADFMGWYIDNTHRITSISKNNAEHLYLAYHEGNGGYRRGTYKSKPWLMETAKAVGARAEKFDNEIKNCDFSRNIFNKLIYKY